MEGGGALKTSVRVESPVQIYRLYDLKDGVQGRELIAGMAALERARSKPQLAYIVTPRHSRKRLTASRSKSYQRGLPLRAFLEAYDAGSIVSLYRRGNDNTNSSRFLRTYV